MNAYTLTFAVLLLMGAALGDRFGRKRLFLIGMAIFTVGSAAAALAPSIGALIAARAVQGVGGAIVTPLTLTLLTEAVPRERRGARARRLGRHQRPRRRARPARRRRGRRGHLVAVDLLAQRPARPDRPADGAGAAAREPRPVHAARPARRGDRDRRRLRPRVGPRAGELAGLDEPRDRGVARRRGVPAGRLRGLGAADAGADAADAPVPQPGILCRQRRVPADVLRDVRVDLPAQPVPAERAGLLTARGRRPHAAVDGHADDRRPDRGRAHRPHRRQAAPGRRAGAAVDRARLDGDGDLAGRALRRHGRARSRSPASAWGSSSPRSRPS